MGCCGYRKPCHSEPVATGVGNRSLLCSSMQHIFDKDAVASGGVIHKDVCVLMIPTKPLNFRKPRIQVNYDFAIGSLIVVNLFKNDL